MFETMNSAIDAVVHCPPRFLSCCPLAYTDVEAQLLAL